MSCIYKIENQINGKVYIGKTTHPIKQRWYEHKYNAIYQPNLKYHLYKAMRKYGIDNFDICCIEEVSDDNDLSERERYWIKYYDSYNNGYNETIGGEGVALYDRNEIIKYWNSGYSVNQICQLIGCSQQPITNALNYFNVPVDERIKRGNLLSIESLNDYKRQVIKKDVQTNEVVEVYESVNEACSILGCARGDLSEIIKLGRTYKGYLFEYGSEPNLKRDFSIKPVKQIDVNTGEVIQIFPSVNQAAVAVDTATTNISRVCKGSGRSKTCKGFKWEYV